MELSDGIDIAAYSIANSQITTMQQIGTELLADLIDTAEIQGAQLTQMMEQSVNPNLGASLDIHI